jgi:hypothetical protein
LNTFADLVIFGLMELGAYFTQTGDIDATYLSLTNRQGTTHTANKIYHSTVRVQSIVGKIKAQELRMVCVCKEDR